MLDNGVFFTSFALTILRRSIYATPWFYLDLCIAYMIFMGMKVMFPWMKLFLNVIRLSGY